ncbi:MAG: isoprenylcysteine carboxylmethyltransferase family protein [Gammaproteobacteria bacterium]|nr:isoprenylcysteine carboxylmethyltransferase family protein [Gammaproteobacteria bacterium]
MTRRAAVAGSVVFFLVAPAVVGGLVPWWITGWRAASGLPGWWLAVAIVGWLLVAAGVGALVWGFARFVTEGHGTPAPVAPPSALVTGGLYSWVRNPMYLAVLGIVIGQALVLGRWELLVYAGVVAAAFLVFVRGYEEPHLQRMFGEEYLAYRRRVPGWWPRRPRS